MSETDKNVGERIRFYRLQKGLSQEQLAFKAEINPSYIGQIELGKKSTTIKTLDKIVNALDITFEDIFSFDKDMNNSSEFPIIDKIKVQLKDRSIEDQDSIYNIMKQILIWKDKI